MYKYSIFSPIMWKSRLCVGRDIVQVNSKFSASYLSISHQIWFEGQKSNSNSTRKHKYMPRIHQILHNLFFDKNHVCVVILKKLVWEYGMEWFGRSISICHGWTRNGALPPIATTSFKHQSDKGRWTFDHSLFGRTEIAKWSMVWIILMACVTLMWPLFLKCLSCDLLSKLVEMMMEDSVSQIHFMWTHVKVELRMPNAELDGGLHYINAPPPQVFTQIPTKYAPTFTPKISQ